MEPAFTALAFVHVALLKACCHFCVPVTLSNLVPTAFESLLALVTRSYIRKLQQLHS